MASKTISINLPASEAAKYEAAIATLIAEIAAFCKTTDERTPPSGNQGGAAGPSWML